jgi:HD superfamily phosphohydrolase
LQYVLGDIRTFAGSAPQSDDITMLEFCYSGMNGDQLTIPALTENLAKVITFLKKDMDDKGLCPSAQFKVIQASEEIFINIAEYPRFDEMKTQVSVDGKLFPLTEISNIIGALSKARLNIPDIRVYVPEEEKSKFDKLKLENYIDLPEIDREKFHGVHYDQIKLF